MKLALQVAVSLAAVALLLVFVVDEREIASVFRRVSLEFVLLACVVATLDRALMAYKWSLLVRAQGHRLGLVSAMKMYCAAMLWGVALPATVGADAVRAVLATRHGIKGTDVVASIVVERVVGFVLALLLAIVCLLVLRSAGVLDAQYDSVVFGGIALLGAAIAAVLMALNGTLMRRAASALPPRLRATRLMQRLQDVAGACRSLGASRATIARFSALTMLEQLLGLMLPWTLAVGLHVQVEPLVLFAIVPVVMLVSRLPVSFDGIGIFEALFIGLFLLAGISAEAAFAIAVAGRVVQLAVAVPWWLMQVTAARTLRPPASGAALKVPPA